MNKGSRAKAQGGTYLQIQTASQRWYPGWVGNSDPERGCAARACWQAWVHPSSPCMQMVSSTGMRGGRGSVEPWGAVVVASAAELAAEAVGLPPAPVLSFITLRIMGPLL